MFDLDREVLAWRREFRRERAFSRNDLDELEDHLRAAYELELYLNPALAPVRAFARARESMGSAQALSREFAKVGGGWWRRLLRIGQAGFGLSFFLPVIRGGIRLGHGGLGEGLLPGVQAMLLSLSGNGIEIVSALTNLAMIGLLWRIDDADRRRVSLTGAVLGACVALNLSWLVRVQPGDLLGGYYVWLGSFVTATIALVLRARALPGDSHESRTSAM